MILKWRLKKARQKCAWGRQFLEREKRNSNRQESDAGDPRAGRRRSFACASAAASQQGRNRRGNGKRVKGTAASPGCFRPRQRGAKGLPGATFETTQAGS